MTISDDLLAMLACPVCLQPVHCLPDDSGLKCDSCKRVYPIRDGFPVMIPDDATIAAE